MFLSTFAESKIALMELSLTNRILHAFWLFGPFILLIERTPADIYLSVLSLAFVYRAVQNRDFRCFKQFWVCAAFAFWLVCLLSAVLSSDSLYSFGEAFIWIRFPLFAMATVFWLAKDKRIFYMMLLSTALGFLVMCGILTAEIIHNGEIGPRLSWPYGDLGSGNYLTKVGLPVIIIAFAIAVSQFNRNAIFAGLFALVSFVFVTFTGERINTLILVGGGVLAGLVWRPNWKLFVVLCLFGVVALATLLYTHPDIYQRYIIIFINQIPTGEHSAYYRAMKPGLLAFEQNPIFGIGTANFRHLCPDIISAFRELECHPHPHNYYFQLLGETGAFGFVFGTVFLWSIVWKCFKARKDLKNNVALGTAWVVPFMLFWPIVSTADFFGQWNNVFMWSSVALALGATNLGKETS